MQISIALLLELGIILAALSLLGALARRFTLSPIPLYLLAGLALGEGGIAPVRAAGAFVETGAGIGVVLLLLVLGLEFTVPEFTVSLRRHLPSAVVDLVLNAAPGALAGWLLGLDATGILALAGVTYISSSGIVARLLTDLRRMGNRETPAVLSVLVLEDFAMAAYLPLLAVVAAGGTWRQALLGVLLALGAVLVAFTVSYWWGHHLGRLLGHPEAEQLLLRVLGVTLIVAALAEAVHVSAAVGAFLVGLSLTGETARRAREVLSPLRDLFAAVFFLAIGLSVSPRTLLPVLPAALLLALVTTMTKVASGWYAARRDGAGRRGRIRAGAALIARGEFSIVIVGLVGLRHDRLGALVAAYVLLLAVAGPVITRFAGARAAGTARPPRHDGAVR
ncbi:cation:proton antiporter [Streptomyces sp. NPDC101225]|uniref:cation:proton antiporter n=1 Tax=Streptomyces sp. NPDC101225 TaxID=3366135 RepID=UPI00382F73A9